MKNPLATAARPMERANNAQTPELQIRKHQRHVAAQVATGIESIRDLSAAGGSCLSAAGRHHFRTMADRKAQYLCALIGCQLPGLRVTLERTPTVLKLLREAGEAHWVLGDAMIDALKPGYEGWNAERRVAALMRDWPWYA